MASQSFTDPEFIQRLDSLYLMARRVLSGSLQADRKSKRKGAGITFADYAEYQPGDDYRSIDWRVYARFDELVIKLFELEEDATVYLLLDRSQSMAAKSLLSRQLAAALGYIGLHSLDRVAAYSLSDQLRPLMTPTRGRSKVMSFLKTLEDCSLIPGETDFTVSCRAFQARRMKRGIVIVLSDFLYPAGYEDGLKFLKWHGHDVFCIQVNDTKELSCDWRGDMDLECVETANRSVVTITDREAKAYEAAVQEWNAELAKTCARRGIGLSSVTTAASFDAVIHDILRRGGLIA